MDQQVQHTLDGSLLRHFYLDSSIENSTLFTAASVSTKNVKSHCDNINKSHKFKFTTSNNEMVTDLMLELVIWCDNPIINDMRRPVNSKITSYGAKLPIYDKSTGQFTDIPENKIEIENYGSFEKTNIGVDKTNLYSEMIEPIFSGIPSRLIENPDDIKYSYIVPIINRIINLFIKIQPSSTGALVVSENLRMLDDLCFKDFISTNFMGSNYKPNNYVMLGGSVNDPYTSTAEARAAKSHIFSKDQIISAIGLVLDGAQKLITSTKYTTLEKFAFYKLILDTMSIKMVYNDNSVVKYNASMISPVHAIMRRLIATLGNNHDPLELLMLTLDEFYGNNYQYDSSLFLTKEFITMVNSMGVLKNALYLESGLLTPFGASVDKSTKSSEKDLVYNSLIKPMKQLMAVKYNDIKKTYKKYTTPYISDDDLLKIDIANLIKLVSFTHSEVIKVDLSGDELKCLFGTDMVKILAVIRDNNGIIKQVRCHVRIGVTSDFENFKNNTQLFDVGNFNATVKFKCGPLVRHHLNPTRIQSTITYKSVLFEVSDSVARCQTIHDDPIVLSRCQISPVELYRVPVPRQYVVYTGTVVPYDLLAPAGRYGVSFVRSVSMGIPVFSIGQTLGNIAAYDISIGELDREYSKNILSDQQTIKPQYQNNSTYSIYIGNPQQIFSGQHCKSKNITIKFEKTDASKNLTVDVANDFNVIPVVEFLLKKSDSTAIPGRSFEFIKSLNEYPHLEI